MLSFCPTYNIALQSGIFARNHDKLESLNKRALRVVFNDKVSSYQQLLYKSEGSNLYNRRIQNMLITIQYDTFVSNLFTTTHVLTFM